MSPTPHPPLGGVRGPVENPRPDRVLVVDDEPEILGLLDLLIRRMGYATNLVGSASQALIELELSPSYEVVLADEGLAGGPCGSELIGEIERRWPHLQCILISGGGRVEHCPDVPFVAKPFQLQKLRSLLRRAAGRTREARAMAHGWSGPRGFAPDLRE